MLPAGATPVEGGGSDVHRRAVAEPGLEHEGTQVHRPRLQDKAVADLQARKPRAAETGTQIEPRDGAWVAEATGLISLSG